MRPLLVCPWSESADYLVRERPRQEVENFLSGVLADWTEAAQAELRDIFQVPSSAQPEQNMDSPTTPPGGPPAS